MPLPGLSQRLNLLFDAYLDKKKQEEEQQWTIQKYLNDTKKKSISLTECRTDVNFTTEKTSDEVWLNIALKYVDRAHENQIYGYESSDYTKVLYRNALEIRLSVAPAALKEKIKIEYTEYYKREREYEQSKYSMSKEAIKGFEKNLNDKLRHIIALGDLKLLFALDLKEIQQIFPNSDIGGFKLGYEYFRDPLNPYEINPNIPIVVQDIFRVIYWDLYIKDSKFAEYLERPVAVLSSLPISSPKTQSDETETHSPEEKKSDHDALNQAKDKSADITIAKPTGKIISEEKINLAHHYIDIYITSREHHYFRSAENIQRANEMRGEITAAQMNENVEKWITLLIKLGRDADTNQSDRMLLSTSFLSEIYHLIRTEFLREIKHTRLAEFKQQLDQLQTELVTRRNKASAEKSNFKTALATIKKSETDVHETLRNLVYLGERHFILKLRVDRLNTKHFGALTTSNALYKIVSIIPGAANYIDETTRFHFEFPSNFLAYSYRPIDSLPITWDPQFPEMFAIKHNKLLVLEESENKDIKAKVEKNIEHLNSEITRIKTSYPTIVDYKADNQETLAAKNIVEKDFLAFKEEIDKLNRLIPTAEENLEKVEHTNIKDELTTRLSSSKMQIALLESTIKLIDTKALEDKKFATEKDSTSGILLALASAVQPTPTPTSVATQSQTTHSTATVAATEAKSGTNTPNEKPSSLPKIQEPELKSGDAAVPPDPLSSSQPIPPTPPTPPPQPTKVIEWKPNEPLTPSRVKLLLQQVIDERIRTQSSKTKILDTLNKQYERAKGKTEFTTKLMQELKEMAAVKETPTVSPSPAY